MPTSDENVCAICLEEVVTSAGACKLECSHVFHTACIFQCSHHDTRCPVCRSSIEGLSRRHTEPQQSPIVEIHFTPREDSDRANYRRQTRNYNARVNRRVKMDEALQRKKNKLQETRRNMIERAEELDKTWKQVEKDAWNSSEMRKLRMDTSKAKRKHKLAEKDFNDSVASIFGSRPDIPDEGEFESLQTIIQSTLFNLQIGR